MLNKIEQLIKGYETEKDFTYAVASDNLIEDAENRLNVKIPKDFIWFLKKYGHGGIGGVEVLGVSKEMKSVFMEETLHYRQYGLPDKLIVIETLDEWLYCIDTSKKNEIVMWFMDGEVSEGVYKSFADYLYDRTNDMIENM